MGYKQGPQNIRSYLDYGGGYGDHHQGFKDAASHFEKYPDNKLDKDRRSFMRAGSKECSTGA